MALLTPPSKSLSVLFALRQHSCRCVENLLHRVKPIASEVRHYVSLVGFRVVITFQIENPICVKMGMDGHMQSVRVLSDLVCFAVLIKVLAIALIFTSPS